MKESQKERQSRPQAQPAQPARTPKSTAAESPAVPQPPYVMSDGSEAHPVSCAPGAPDTR